MRWLSHAEPSFPRNVAYTSVVLCCVVLCTALWNCTSSFGRVIFKPRSWFYLRVPARWVFTSDHVAAVCCMLPPFPLIHFILSGYFMCDYCSFKRNEPVIRSPLLCSFSSVKCNCFFSYSSKFRQSSFMSASFGVIMFNSNSMFYILTSLHPGFQIHTHWNVIERDVPVVTLYI